MSFEKITVITPLTNGYCLIKRDGEEPTFEVWLGTSTVRDFVACFNFSDAVKLLLSGGVCENHEEAINLLNYGDFNA